MFAYAALLLAISGTRCQRTPSHSGRASSAFAVRLGRGLVMGVALRHMIAGLLFCLIASCYHSHYYAAIYW